MAEAVRGINKIILMRPIELQSTNAAGKLAYQTEHTVTRTRDSESTATKDGNVVSTSEIAVEMSLTSIMAQEDTVKDLLEASFDNNTLVEFWDINKTVAHVSGDDNNGKYPARYYQGYITDWEESDPVDGAVEISLSISINGSGVSGYATLTDDQAAVVQYEFVDTTAQG